MISRYPSCSTLKWLCVVVPLLQVYRYPPLSPLPSFTVFASLYPSPRSLSLSRYSSLSFASLTPFIYLPLPHSFPPSLHCYALRPVSDPFPITVNAFVPSSTKGMVGTVGIYESINQSINHCFLCCLIPTHPCSPTTKMRKCGPSMVS